VVRKIVEYMKSKEGEYRLIVGTDSQETEDNVVFVTAIVLHRKGKGGIYFYKKVRNDEKREIHQRIFYEAYLSLNVAGKILLGFSEIEGAAPPEIEIHLDVGGNGKTRDMVHSIVGMITGSGFKAFIKPEAFGATKVADKYTKS